MSEELQAAAPVDAPQPPGWEQALDDVERRLSEVNDAVTRLRRCLAGDDGVVGGDVATVDVATVDVATVDVAQGPPAKGEAGRSAFDRLWNRIESEQESKDEEPPAEPAEERRGLDLLPKRYLITVEDRDGSVDLVPLHRALMGVDGVEEISLVSYANGVPVISLQAEGELDLEQLDSVVGKAMDRQCEVIPQDNGKLYLRMQARED